MWNDVFSENCFGVIQSKLARSNSKFSYDIEDFHWVKPALPNRLKYLNYLKYYNSLRNHKFKKAHHGFSNQYY